MTAPSVTYFDTFGGSIVARPKTIEYRQYSNFQDGECNQDSPADVFELFRFRRFDLEICGGDMFAAFKVTSFAHDQAGPELMLTGKFGI